MSRRECFACVGIAIGFAIARHVEASLPSSPGWSALLIGEPLAARYVSTLLVLPLPFVGAVLACALVNFAEVHGFVQPQRQRRKALPRYPFSPSRTQLVIGEIHHQDGSPSEQPSWLVLPEKGLYTGILITGPPGSAKTSTPQHPFP